MTSIRFTGMMAMKDKDIKQKLLDREIALAPAAARSNRAIFRHTEKERDGGPRLNYWRDSDRIIHSFSFNRYIDKTQVFSNIEDDRISHRVIHVQFLSKISRFISRVLDVNEDLTEAIALGHDVGHCPFGHEGEKVLDRACERHGIGHFHHNAQSVVFLDQLESAYKKQENGFPGLNLSLQTLDGILCHNGEIHTREVVPAQVPGITADDAIAGIDSNLRKMIETKHDIDLQPITIEACIVRFVDTISYIGRDIEDAITLGLITRDDIPDTMLGKSNRIIIDILVKDLIKNTQASELAKVSYSKDVHQALEKLYAFNMARIYKHPVLTEKIKQIPAQIDALFEAVCNDVASQDENSAVFRDHVALIGKDYFDNYIDTPAIIARDFIAGMTDRYFKHLTARTEQP
nr:HD domain-containing protein [Candidatus Sigynarchaeota archaeon]